MQRDKYPEKVPFRLTRMLIHAMEVCGITGTFSRSCEVSMEVLRANKESLMAVLEAFVYDPLINWRLTAGANQGGRQQATHDVEERGGQPYGVQRAAGRADERDILLEADRPEVMNDKALQVIERVRRKLTGELGPKLRRNEGSDGQDATLSRILPSTPRSRLRSLLARLHRSRTSALLSLDGAPFGKMGKLFYAFLDVV